MQKIIIHCYNLKRSYLTLSDINYIVDKKKLDNLQFNKEIENIFYLNNLQEAFIYHFLTVNKFNDSYFNQALYEFNTSIDSNILFEAWKISRKRFSVLRSKYFWQDKLIQIIEKYDENTN